jgi:GT2 family glycosyltransferase
MTATIDVVIPTFNNRDELLVCLDSLRDQGRSDIRALVCVDGSSDGSTEAVEQRADPFEIVVLVHKDGRNRGRAAARNLALPQLSARWVLFLDSDMRLRPGAIERHLQAMEREPVVSVGQVVYLNASSSLWARYQTTRGKNRRRPGERLRPLDFNSQHVAMATGDFRALGGFDEAFHEYGGEDTELGLRLGELGRPLVFTADAIAETVDDAPVDARLAQLDRFSKTNLPLIRQRHPNGPAPFWIDRLESNRTQDRVLRMLLNPVSDWLARALLPRTPFPVQRVLLNYLVIRTVFRGYAQATR